GRELPAPTGWYYGDIHTHSLYTNNIYEYGGALEMYPACAEAIGLSFTAVSDHSSDYDANGDLWQQMADDCVTYSTEAVHLIPAEEVSLDDNEVDETIDNRIHMLNYSGIFIPGPEAPISGSMHTSSRFTFLSEAIPQMEGVGGFYYAAHPFQDYDPFAYLFGMAMMPWSEENYTLSRSTYTFSGLQLWNERNFYKKNVSYSYYLDPFPWQLNPTWGTESAWVNEGIAQWDEFLSIGLAENLINTALLPYKSFISAGSDCHGDFNYRTYNVDPIFFDVYATDNAFGNLRTCVYVPGYEAGQLPPVEELLTSYRLGRSFITDGPSLIMGIDTNGDGDLNDAEDLNIGDQNNIFSTEVSQAQCIIRWESTEDWGALESMVLYHGTSATGSAPTAAWTYGSGGYLVEQIIPLSTLVSSPTNGWEYLRAEAIGAPQSDGARQAYTNPVWIRIDTTPTSSVTLESAEDLIFISENGGSFEYTITIENHQSTSINCGVWMDVALPNGNVFPLLNVPVTLPASQAISRPREQTVPPDAPPGVYAYQAHIGDYPTAWSSSQISFIKIGETNNRGLLVDWPASEPIFNTEKLQNSSPSGFKLGAYPNPFNPTTTLSYELRVAGSVLLNVYDIQGCEVAKLVDDYRDAGVHEVTFDASGLASGVYLYRLIHASSQKGQKHATLTGKMVLLK
ncbi:T9SS type A sorting domain-containing protein, partial [bacterium]|nr:T9SS type A sorting domain-containing protein [bacterium]